jgi:hypothetical protein
MRTIRRIGLAAVLSVAFATPALVAPVAGLANGAPKHHQDRHGHHHRAHQRRHHRRQARRNHHHRGRQHGPRASIAAPAQFGAALAVAPAAPRITGTTYYVSPTGSDSNTGTSPTEAWRTIGHVNYVNLRPGDAVLFQGGATFSDDTLMPNVSGAAGAPIVFGSYGIGRASIPHGVWFIDHDYLTFDRLRLGPYDGLQGGNDYGHFANHVVVQRCLIELSATNPRVGISSDGDDWTISDNIIRRIGNSGMLLNHGSDYTITGNTITNTGLDSAISYGKHGIYLKVSNATVTDNTITYFSADAVSPRYRDSTITGNLFAHGAIGIGFFEYDSGASVSHWSDNEILDTHAAGIYATSDIASLVESFVITDNVINVAEGAPIYIDHTLGWTQIAGNQL